MRLSQKSKNTKRPLRNKNKTNLPKKTIKLKQYTKICLYKGREKGNNMKHKIKNNETHITNIDSR